MCILTKRDFTETLLVVIIFLTSLSETIQERKNSLQFCGFLPSVYCISSRTVYTERTNQQPHGVGRLRHLHKKELWLQDQIAPKTVELGRVSGEDIEADLGTKYLERYRIKKCVAMMEMLFAGAWAGEQLLVVSRIEVIIWEDLIEGQNWTIGVVLLVTVGSGTA